MKVIEPKEYAIQPELRRCCWYVIIGVVLVAGCVWCVRSLLDLAPPTMGDWLVACAFCFIPIALSCVALRMRLRVDRYGLWRSFVMTWEHWPWEDFANGNVQKQRGARLYDGSRPWWNRTLCFGLVAPDELAEIYAIINEHYTLPPAPELPAELTINYGPFRRHWVTLTTEGLQVSQGDKSYDYLWSEVRDIHILREESLRRDFSHLLLTLPDCEVDLKIVRTQHTSHENWGGASHEEISEFISQYAPAEVVHVTVAGEPVMSRAFIDYQLRDIATRTRGLKVMGWIFGPILAGLFLWMVFFEAGFLPTLIMFALPAAFFAPVFYLLSRRVSMRKRELENRLLVLEEDSL